MRPLCRLVTDPIDATALLREVRTDADGAVATFCGVVRDHHRGREVDHLEYHAYAEMAAEELERIAAELRQRFRVGRIGLVHRIGTLAIGEVAVLVAVAAPHRREALACAAAAIEAIKQRLPVWKKEFFRDGGPPEWVFGPDDECAAAPA